MMCGSCGWQSADRIMMRLRAYKLAAISRWVDSKKCIAERQWRAIIRVSNKLNMPIDADELPDFLREPDLEALHSLPDFEDGDDHAEI